MSKKEPKARPASNPRKQKPGRPDARIRRTHERLGSALMELIRQKPIDAISVQEVLDRAAVGRSTFYLHFRDKNDLLLSQLEMFLELMSTMLSLRNEASRRVAPVAEMFEHIGQQQKVYRSLAESGVLDEFFTLAQGYFERGIERRLSASKRTAGISQAELRARSVALAGSLLALFRWWIDHGGKQPASEMDKLFHRMVWNGMAPQ